MYWSKDVAELSIGGKIIQAIIIQLNVILRRIVADKEPKEKKKGGDGGASSRYVHREANLSIYVKQAEVHFSGSSKTMAVVMVKKT